MTPLDRRSFLSGAAAAAASLSLSRLPAAEPIVRNGKPHLKLSLAAYSFNRMLTRHWTKPGNDQATMRLEEVIDFAADQDFDAIELTSYYFPREVTNDYLASLKERCFRLGLDISGTAIGNDFCVPAGQEWDAQVELARQWIDFAAEMDAPVIRIFAGKVPKGDTEAAALDRCVAGINAVLPHAAKRGVSLALENHGGITATPQQLLAIVKRIDPSPWFGINFDSGNFHTADPYGDLEQIAPYANNAQIKASVSPAPENKKQPADLKRIVNILKAANYRGYLVLEYEDVEDPHTAIPRLASELRGLIA